MITVRQRDNERRKRQRAAKNMIVLLLFALLLLLSFLISMNTGYSKLSPPDTLRILFGAGSDRENLILFQFRLPRIVISVLVGAGLSLSGCIIQGITRNALAEPGLLGINAGAGLMVILFVLFFDSRQFISVFTLPFIALLGAGTAAIAVYMLSRKKGEESDPLRLILTGIAVQAGISALTTVLVVKLDETKFNFVASWQAGSIWGSNWQFVLALLPWLLLVIPYVLSKSRILDALNLGDDIALGLGISVEKERRGLLAAAVALAASSVAVSGSISFAGLIAPHLARRLVGPSHGILLPVCAITGALLVSAADTAARVIVQPEELPTGIMVAIIGAPYFLYLLISNRQ
jgi:iron complex transport system permease protein